MAAKKFRIKAELSERSNTVMRKKQENRFTMIKAVRTYLSEKQDIVSEISELVNSKAILDEIHDNLKAKEQEKNNSFAGKAAAKLAMKEALIKSSRSVSAALFAYAKKTGNIVISELTDIPKSSLELMRDTMLVEAMEGLKNLAVPVIGELGPYGISQEKLDAFTEKINDYDKSIGDSETGRVTRKGAVKTLKLLFSETDELFEVMDKLVNGIDDKSKQEFVRGYNDARKVRNMGIRHKADKDLPVQEPESEPEQK